MKNKIMFIITSLSGGGAERVTATLAGLFAEYCDVYVVTQKDKDVVYHLDERIQVIPLNIGGGHGIRKIVNTWKRVKRIRKLKKKLGITVSISMLLQPNFENVLSRNREKVIISIRNKCSSKLNRLEGMINMYSCKKADKVVALSKNVMDDQIRYYRTPKDRVLTIYNPCDIDLIREMKKQQTGVQFEQIRNSFKHVIITAGRLVDQKGQWHMIRAFSRLASTDADTALVMLGVGPLESYFKELISELNLSDRVFLLGFHENPYPFLAKADLFLFTSLYEGFGNVLIEAMACDLPIISCDCNAGPRELLSPDSDLYAFAQNMERGQFGILIPQMDGKHYSAADPLSREEILCAETLAYVLKDQEMLEHYRNMSRQRVQDFQQNKIFSEWEQLTGMIENR